MRLAVFSHKVCWPSNQSATGFATDGGFPFQMKAISELFDATTLVVPINYEMHSVGEIPLLGHHISVVPLTLPFGKGLRRKLALPFWFLRHIYTIFKALWTADAVHTPIPGDIGTIGMLLAVLLKKPLFVRYCGNWFVQKTVAEHLWLWFMKRFAGGRNVMFATGGAAQMPAPNIQWIFATSLADAELKAYEPRQKLPITPRLIIVCRQGKAKGTDIVIDAFALLVEEFPDLKLDVVGDGRDLEAFKHQVARLGLSQQITFHGRVNHERVMALLSQATLFCYPTLSEGFPKVVLEALACGLPVITTHVSVLPQLIGQGCGLLLKERTATALQQAVRSCLLDEQTYGQMSLWATQVAQQYSLEQWQNKIKDALKAKWGPLQTND